MVTTSQEITNITCILVTSHVGQLHMRVLYKKNGPTRAKKPSLAQLDQIKMAQTAITTVRIQHCALTQKGLQTRNGDQFVSFCLLFFIQIWRISFDGDQLELVTVGSQMRHNEHQLDVANSSSWPSSCKSCSKKIGPTGAKKPSMQDKQHHIGSHYTPTSTGLPTRKWWLMVQWTIDNLSLSICCFGSKLEEAHVMASTLKL
jgi:hypothetical protein